MTILVLLYYFYMLWEAQWLNGSRPGLRIERSGFKSWPGYCVVFLDKTLLSQCLSSPEVYKWVLVNLMLGHPIQGAVEILYPCLPHPKDNKNNFRLVVPLGSYAVLILPVIVMICPQNAPHTQDVVTSDIWDRPYSREVAAFPAVSIKLLSF